MSDDTMLYEMSTLMNCEWSGGLALPLDVMMAARIVRRRDAVLTTTINP